MANETLRDQQALFAVPMTCEGCVKDVSDSLYKVDGISKVEANLKEQLVRVEGTGMSSAGHSVSFCASRCAIHDEASAWPGIADPGDWRERVH